MAMHVEHLVIKPALLHLNKYTVAYVNSYRFRIDSVSPGGISDNQPDSFIKVIKKILMERFSFFS